MDKRTCTGCGAEFIPHHGRQRCCSAECRKPTHAKVVLSCDHCGGPAIKYKQTKRYARTYCSRECMGRGFTKPPTRITPAVDRRTALRKAIEDDGDVIGAIKLDCEISPSGCWNWTRRLSRDGYPAVRIAKRDRQVHRLALEAKVGAVLGSQAAHHTCANTRCVNPDHLQPVTHAENNAEMLARKYMVARISQLEEALRSLCPTHPALAEVSVPSNVLA